MAKVVKACGPADPAGGLITAIRNRSAKEVSALLKAGASVQAIDPESPEPLDVTCEETDALIAKLLLRAGADPNKANGRGMTPVMTGARPGGAEVIKVLIENGADVNARDKQGWTALFHVIVLSGMAVRITSFQSIPEGETLESLLQKQAFQPVGFAADVVEELIRNGMDPNAQDNEGRTAITYARTSEAAELLIKHGASLTIKDKKGITAEKWMAKNGISLKPSSSIRGPAKKRVSRNVKRPA